MTSKRPVVLASAAPRTTCGEETVHDGDTRKKPKFATTTARKVPLEFSASEEIWYGLTRPRRLPRIPGSHASPSSKDRGFRRRADPEASQDIASSPTCPAPPWFRGMALDIRRCDRLDRRPPVRGASLSLGARAVPEVALTARREGSGSNVGPRSDRRWKSRQYGPSPFDDLYAACYTYSDSAVTFNSQHEFFEFELMDSAAHESVHAIIHQNGLRPYSTTHDDFFAMVDETAASVLGAHIAGEVWSRSGRDGSILTEVLYQQPPALVRPSQPRQHVQPVSCAGPRRLRRIRPR